MQTKHVECIETGQVFKSAKAAAEYCGRKKFCHNSIAVGCAFAGLHFRYTDEDVRPGDGSAEPATSSMDCLGREKHLCPDCAVPIKNCGWWHGLRPPEGAKTGIRQISEYEGKGSGKRVAVDRVIVVECPNYREAQKKKNESTLSTTQEPYHELANAVILSAVKDYRSARKAKDRHKVGSIRRFFRSDYFSVLSDLDGEVLIKKLNEEVKNDKTGT